jgi:hypothetical protein
VFELNDAARPSAATIGHSAPTGGDCVARFDADCGICNWLAAKIAPSVPGVTFTPLGPEDPQIFTLTHAGTVFTGSRAMAEILRMSSVAAHRALGRTMRSFPLSLLASALYHLIARNRSRLSKVLGLEACRLIGE